MQFFRDKTSVQNCLRIISDRITKGSLASVEMTSSAVVECNMVGHGITIRVVDVWIKKSIVEPIIYFDILKKFTLT